LIEDGFCCQVFFISIEFFFGRGIAVDLLAIDMAAMAVVVVVHETNHVHAAIGGWKNCRRKQNFVTTRQQPLNNK